MGVSFLKPRAARIGFQRGELESSKPIRAAGEEEKENTHSYPLP
jgi:hypothetical protein